MKHKFGDVVLVPMKIGGGWVNSNGTGHFAYVVGEKDVSAAITDDFLDTCAAAPRVPKVGDRVRVALGSRAWEVVAIRGDCAVLWSDSLGASVAPLLSDLTVVDEAAP